MARKIYDIKPPKAAQKVEKSDKSAKRILTGLSQSRPKASSGAEARHRAHRKEKRSLLPQIVVIASVLAVFMAIYLFFKLPKAEITVWPKVDTLSYQEEITADKSAVLVDISKNIIPAQYFETTKTETQDFPATGNALNEGLASGTITIYNKYDPPTPFTFKAGTHFMSDSGKLFVAPQKIIIPAAKKSGGKITPGSVQVQVRAVEGGSGYNIAPSNFSVPGLKGTAYYYSVYAESTKAMEGGYTGEIKKITDGDIQDAKNTLTQKTAEDTISALKAQIPSDYVLLDNAISSKTSNVSTGAKAGVVADNFSCQATVTASALAFKKSDIEQYVKDYIISRMPDGKVLVADSLKTDFSTNLVDVSNGKVKMSLSFSSGIYKEIDRNSLALSLLGKNENKVKDTINEALDGEVSGIKVKLWPFWVSSVPNSQKAVNIELKFQ